MKEAMIVGEGKRSRSFDSGAHDEAMRHSTQDDRDIMSILRIGMLDIKTFEF